MIDNKYPLCIKCLNCKIKKNLVSCKMNHFKNKTLSCVIITTALDYNCDSFENFEPFQGEEQF
jgi:hypothetical protein